MTYHLCQSALLPLPSRVPSHLDHAHGNMRTCSGTSPPVCVCGGIQSLQYCGSTTQQHAAHSADGHTVLISQVELVSVWDSCRLARVSLPLMKLIAMSRNGRSRPTPQRSVRLQSPDQQQCSQSVVYGVFCKATYVGAAEATVRRPRLAATQRPPPRSNHSPARMCGIRVSSYFIRCGMGIELTQEDYQPIESFDIPMGKVLRLTHRLLQLDVKKIGPRSAHVLV